MVFPGAVPSTSYFQGALLDAIALNSLGHEHRRPASGPVPALVPGRVDIEHVRALLRWSFEAERTCIKAQVASS